MADNDAPTAWRSVSFSAYATEFPIRLVNVKRPAALTGSTSSVLDLLSNLNPPDPAGAGVHAWDARVCYWSPEQLEQLQKYEVPPTLVYRFGGMPGPTDAKQWSTLLRLLREQQPRNQQAHKQQQGDQPEEVQQQQTAAADDTTAAAISSVGPIHGVAKQLDGQFRNVLLLHVAGRYNDHSIKLLLVPKLDPEALTSRPSERVMLWAYFMVLPPFSIEQRILMEQHHHMAPLTLDVVKTALKPRRLQEKQWQSCVEYHVNNQPRDDGLPAWMSNVTCARCHLSHASPRGQLDIVDRSFVDRQNDDRASAAAANAGSGQPCDSCACGYAAAGAENLQLVPLRCGPASQFGLPCSCPPEWWCGNALRRRQLLQLWNHEQLPRLKIQNCGGGKGLGLLAVEDILGGTAIGVYCGEAVTQPEMNKREELYQQAGLFYVWQEIGLKSQPPEVAIAQEQARQEQRAAGNKRKRKEDKDALIAIDATWMGGVTRFINHSCDPNCQAVTVCNSKGTLGIDGKPMMICLIETQRDIKAGEELTFDYSPVDDDTWEKVVKQQQRGSQSRGRAAKPAAEGRSTDDRRGVRFQGRVPCECGAAKCRGVIFWEKSQNGDPILAVPS